MHFNYLSKRGALCLMAAVSAGAVPAYSQQALFNGLADGIPVPPGGNFAPSDKPIQWGPARLAVGASYALQYNDNVFNAPNNRQWDLINTLQLDLGVYLPLFSATDSSPLQFSLGIGYSFYARNTQLNRLILAPRSSLAWTIPLDQVSLTFYDSMAYTANPLLEPGLSGTGTFSTFQNSVGARATWTPDRYVLTLGASYQNYLSTVSQYDYINHHGPNFLAQAGYKITPETQAGLDVSVGVNQFTDPRRSNFNSYSFGPYLTWRVLETLTVKARTGYVLYDFARVLAGAPQRSFDSYYVNFDAAHQLTEYISHSLTFSREFSPGVASASSQLAQNSAVTYSPRWRFTDFATLFATGSYEFGNNAVVGVGSTYNRWGAGLGVTFSLTDRLNTSLIYQWYSKTSPFGFQDYIVNTVTWSANYSF
jgi:hypothetical protein